MAVYAAQIERMDTNVGRLMDKLKKLGVEENTLVLFISDNGGSGRGSEPRQARAPCWGRATALRAMRAVGYGQQYAVALP